MLLRHLLMSVVLAATLGAAGPSRAAEGEPGGPPDKGGLKEGDKGGKADRERLKEILRKQRAGEELTAEEKALLEKARGRGGKERPGVPDRPVPEAGRQQPGIEGLDLVNAVDAVRFALAQVYLGKQEPDKAVGALEKVVKSSQDKTAVGFAHLALARIYRQKGDGGKCDEELKKVSGPAVFGALNMMLEGGDAEARLEELLKGAEDPVLKAMILRRLAMLYARGGNVEKLSELAERAGKLLSYKEALAAQEAEQKMAQAMPPRPGAGGPPWMRPGMGEGRKGGPEDLEALQKEIKELEAAGMVEEAEALKKQLRFLEERRGGNKKGARANPQPLPAGEDNVF